ncbi:MAG: STAS domain-containing protein [Pseudomonadota bacterium]|jgi:ABC-type transporter Mla MlaB component|nr:STAS domain-containing protein [Xanthomonadaceae bacterium]MDE3210795.1 STAS domain-containing protein [Pseudomonadota bacterium]
MTSKRKAAPPAAAVQAEGACTEPVVLPAECRMAALPALKEVLLAALALPAVALDGRRVERADTAALQLLALFRRELVGNGGSLSWLGASEPLIEAVGLLGLTQTLELPATALA